MEISCFIFSYLKKVNDISGISLNFMFFVKFKIKIFTFAKKPDVKDEDLKKVHELALKQLLETNESQVRQINELQNEIRKLKDRLGFSDGQKNIDVAKIIEENRVLSQKVSILETEIEKAKNESLLSSFSVEKEQVSSKTEKKDIGKRLVFTAVDSFGISVIAYLFTFVFCNYVIIYAGNIFNFHGTLRYFGIEWSMVFDPVLWNSESVVKVFFSGPAASLALSAVLFLVLKLFKHIYYKYRLFFAWVSLYSLNSFFGSYVSGIFTGESFGYVPVALGLDFGIDLIIVLFMLLMLYILGAVMTKPFLYAASSFSLAENQSRFLRYQVLYPAIAMNILIIPVKLPGLTLYEFICLFTVFVSIIPMFYSSSMIFVRSSNISFRKNYKLQGFSQEIILFALILLIAFRFFLRSV